MFLFNKAVSVFLVLGLLLVLSRLILSASHLLNCLIVVEKINVLLLFCCILGAGDSFRLFFVALMVVFTVEVVLGLLVLTRL